MTFISARGKMLTSFFFLQFSIWTAGKIHVTQNSLTTLKNSTPLPAPAYSISTLTDFVYMNFLLKIKLYLSWAAISSWIMLTTYRSWWKWLPKQQHPQHSVWFYSLKIIWFAQPSNPFVSSLTCLDILEERWAALHTFFLTMRL